MPALLAVGSLRESTSESDDVSEPLWLMAGEKDGTTFLRACKIGWLSSVFPVELPDGRVDRAICSPDIVRLRLWNSAALDMPEYNRSNCCVLADFVASLEFLND